MDPNCATLAGTGFPLAQLLTVGVCGVLVGLLLLVAIAGTRKRAAALVVVAILAAIACTGDASLAHASAPNCAGGSGTAGPDKLTIVQTSTNTGMAPGVAPASITGRITNRGDHPVFVTAVVVRIVGIDRRISPTPSACYPSDYILVAATMPVNVTIGVGASTDFTGASIGFNDTARDQDGCQDAIVHLRFDARST
jgi:hypothetical protein